MKKIFVFLFMLFSLVSCKDEFSVMYTDEEFEKSNNGGVIISKGQSEIEDGKLVYVINLKNSDSSWTAYGVSKNVYDKYDIRDTVKYIDPIVSSKDELSVEYTDEDFARKNKGGIVISKGQSKTVDKKLVYVVGLKNRDSTWSAYGVSKNVYDSYELDDTVKYVEPVINNNISANIEKIDITIYLENDTIKITNFIGTK